MRASGTATRTSTKIIATAFATALGAGCRPDRWSSLPLSEPDRSGPSAPACGGVNVNCYSSPLSVRSEIPARRPGRMEALRRDRS